MSTITTSTPSQTERLALGRLWRAEPLTVIAAVIANNIVRAIATRLLGVSPEFNPMGSVTFLTVVGVTGAVIVFAAVGRFARRPVRLFRIIAGVTLLLSFLPDLALLSARPFPGTNVMLGLVFPKRDQ